MRTALRGLLVLPTFLATLYLSGGCGPRDPTEVNVPPELRAQFEADRKANKLPDLSKGGTTQARPPMPPGGSGGGPRPGAGAKAAGGPPSRVRQIMGVLTKGDHSLTPVLAKELKEEKPPWDTIQKQTAEYAKLTKEMKGAKPPRGSQESWEKLTTTFADRAAELDKAAQEKDKDAALAVHSEISRSCMGCHREHRPMGPPGGGPGGPRPGGGPGGGRMPSGFSGAKDYPGLSKPSGGPPPGGPAPASKDGQDSKSGKSEKSPGS